MDARIEAELATNKRAWNQVARKFSGHCALPDWGPFGECRSIGMLGDLRGRTVMEVGCGSGHSISHVVKRGAERVYGIDISSTQIALATERNRVDIDAGRVFLIEAPMEQALNLRGIDLIFSIHAIGWTRDPAATFRNLAAYLKPRGRLIWSWGHPLFPEVLCVDGKFVLRESYSYFNEQSQVAAQWHGSEGTVVQHRMLSTWLRHITQAGLVIRQLLEPEAESCPDRVFNNNRLIPMVKARLLPSTLVYVCEKV
ncbi:MAG TPA: class I SAM-dependent methyltransferase [Bryobacteraceae bacterium]|jgi:SAM-dependent methyltransferase